MKDDNDLDIIIDNIDKVLEKYKDEEKEAYERIKALKEKREKG